MYTNKWTFKIACPCRLTFTWWGCSGLCFWHKPTELAHSFLFCCCVCFCFSGPLNCISFHKFSRQLSVFSLCSSGLISALSILSSIHLFMKSGVVRTIYGMKYSWKGHKDRNRYKNRIKRSWASSVDSVRNINRNIPTTWRWARGDVCSRLWRNPDRWRRKR